MFNVRLICRNGQLGGTKTLIWEGPFVVQCGNKTALSGYLAAPGVTALAILRWLEAPFHL